MICKIEKQKKVDHLELNFARICIPTTFYRKYAFSPDFRYYYESFPPPPLGWQELLMIGWWQLGSSIYLIGSIKS